MRWRRRVEASEPPVLLPVQIVSVSPADRGQYGRFTISKRLSLSIRRDHLSPQTYGQNQALHFFSGQVRLPTTDKEHDLERVSV